MSVVNPTQAKKNRNDSQEGAAMLVVMVTLLMVTSIAAFSVHATSFEVRASGFSRQAMQAEYMSEAGLRSTFAMLENPGFGPRGVLYGIEQSSALGNAAPVMTPYEPPLAIDKEGYRLYSGDYANFGGLIPISKDALGGTRQALTPRFYADVNDHYVYSGIQPGERSDGRGALKYLVGTYTIRSSMVVDTPLTDTLTDLGGGNFDARAFHQISGSSRGYAVTGPY